MIPVIVSFPPLLWHNALTEAFEKEFKILPAVVGESDSREALAAISKLLFGSYSPFMQFKPSWKALVPATVGRSSYVN